MEIGKVASFPLIFNHLNWNPSYIYSRTLINFINLMSHSYESWYNSVSWVDDEETRLKAAYWANIVTYRIFTRALGAIGKFHFRWSNITRVSTRPKKKISKFDMVRVFTRPRKIFLVRVETLIIKKFERFLGACENPKHNTIEIWLISISLMV